MAAVIYIHGFLSSPASKKAQITQRWFAEHFPDIDFYCPHLSSYPAKARQGLNELLDSISATAIYAVGSSLGGFWATHFIEQQRIHKAVLVNPGVLPQSRFHEFIGQPLASFYTDEVFTLSEQDLEDLADADVAVPQYPERYWLMVQKGDETLDYRLAVDKYCDARQLVEEGGSHTFDDYEKWLPEIARFFGI